MSKIVKPNQLEQKQPGYVKVRVSRDVLAHFFHHDNRAFSVSKGLPKDAELVDFAYNQESGEGVAVFTHPMFLATPKGAQIPWYEVEYTAYEIT